MTKPKNLLWFDSIAGLSVGVFVTSLGTWLAPFYGLPSWVLMTTGVANLVYGSYSFTLARKGKRSMGSVMFLIIANMCWPIVCIILAANSPDANWLGYAHLFGEAVFVFVLSLVELKYRDELVLSPFQNEVAA